MEPVFMILAESSALAAGLAIEMGCDVQEIPYERMRQRLDQAGQVLERSERQNSVMNETYSESVQ